MLRSERTIVVSIRRSLVNAMRQAGDNARWIAFVLLIPAARLPRPWAVAAADFVGSLFAAASVGARVRREMACAFPFGDASAITLEWIRRPFRDFVAARRIAKGLDDPALLSFKSIGEPPCVREPGQSLIIAAGHFSREAMTGLYAADNIPKRLATVVAGVEDKPSDARGRRLRLQLGELVRGIERARKGDVEIVRVVAGVSIFGRLVNFLRQPGSVVVLAPDAVWPSSKLGGFERAFAGFASHGFAFGAARLARLAQCPIVTCAPYMDEQGGVVIEWGELIAAPDRKDADADMRISNQMLDEIEHAIGARPGQYVQSIGHDRRWDPVSRKWRTAAARPVSPLPRREQEVVSS